MKKVLAIAPYAYLPYSSGGQKFIAQFFEYLGHETELSVVTHIDNDPTLVNGYKTIPLLRRSFTRYFDRSLTGKIVSLVKANQYDTLIIEHPYLAWLAFAIRKRTGIKVFIHTHNIEFQRFRSTGKWWWPVLKYYEKRSFRKSDGIFFISPEDKTFAISAWKIPPEKCIDLPFGVEISSHPADREICKEKTARIHGITPGEKILLFTGVLNYKPNLDALKIILDQINPVLLKDPSFHYKIIICGKGLPDELNGLKDYTDKHIIYAGFIDDIATYYKGADLFLNPVLSGGGVKTKIVEAIAYGTTVISTSTGASGMVKEVCGEKLRVVNDNDWTRFINNILNTDYSKTITPGEYYKTYSWKYIIKNIINI